jgi:hypothetical protein
MLSKPYKVAQEGLVLVLALWFSEELLWRRERVSVDLTGAGSLARAGCSDPTPVASTYEGFL